MNRQFDITNDSRDAAKGNIRDPNEMDRAVDKLRAIMRLVFSDAGPSALLSDFSDLFPAT